jgi:repressor LexA|tara:strand:- start:2078 stop:2692 length:615 start_codon:yes stop_codon:yes gene_type:complete
MENLMRIAMLTDREQDTYQFIKSYYHSKRKAPLLLEIAEGLGIRSKGVVHRYVSSLEEQGYIVRHAKTRGISLVDRTDIDELPMLGRIAAGKPIEAIEDQQVVNFSHLLGGANRFVLQVKGHSMIDEGIRNGDFVVIESQTTAVSNQIVVALVDNENATLKRIQFPKKNIICLIPENKNMQAKEYSSDRISIQGVLVGQVRMYV